MWYSGGDTEGPDNYVQLVTSEDGLTWSDPILVIDPPATVRAFDPVLWVDPQSRLWLFWAQSDGWFDGRAGVWAINALGSGGPLNWSDPRRVADGVMMNKPLATRSGDWLLPVSVWNHVETRHADIHPGALASHVVASRDCGGTWQRRGGVDIPDHSFDEHMIVERADGSLWMLVRLKCGIGESVSRDGGWTWSPGSKSPIDHPNSRFFIRTTRSGDILLVRHQGHTERSRLTAYLSRDDGATWCGGLVIDERTGVSYPDGIETEDDLFVIIYDRNRYSDREILTATFTREDVLNGASVSDKGSLRVLLNAACA